MVNVCGRKIIFGNDVKSKDLFSSNIIRYFFEPLSNFMNSVSLPCFSIFVVDPIIHFIVLYKPKKKLLFSAHHDISLFDV